MQRQWSSEALVEHWTLSSSELLLLANKTGATRLGFAVLVKFFQRDDRFPERAQVVPATAVAHGAAHTPPRQAVHIWGAVMANGHACQTPQ